MSSGRRRRGPCRRVERVLRELHAGSAAWARRVRALLRPDRRRNRVLSLRSRWGLGGRDGPDLVLDGWGAAPPRAGRLQALHGPARQVPRRRTGGGAVAPPART